jgi:hypothetical protein
MVIQDQAKPPRLPFEAPEQPIPDAASLIQQPELFPALELQLLRHLRKYAISEGGYRLANPAPTSVNTALAIADAFQLGLNSYSHTLRLTQAVQEGHLFEDELTATLLKVTQRWHTWWTGFSVEDEEGLVALLGMSKRWLQASLEACSGDTSFALAEGNRVLRQIGRLARKVINPGTNDPHLDF